MTFALMLAVLLVACCVDVSLALGLCAFKVPFAEPPVGSLRFENPVPVNDVVPALSACPTNPFDLINLAPACPQSSPPVAGAVVTEDCLYLNVYAPAVRPTNGKTWPVLVFFYGGSYVSGSIDIPIYDGSVIANLKNDTIVVTTNYRLGALGFASFQGLPTNFGLRDQLAALEWVKNNIHNYGGDPQQVTCSGESAGGAALCALATSPLAEGLFHGMIMESGLCQDVTTRADVTAQTQQLTSRLNCTSVDCVRRASWQDVVAQQSGLQQNQLLTPWSPCVDDDVLMGIPAVQLARPNGVIKSLRRAVIGTNQNESTIFEFLSPRGRALTPPQALALLQNAKIPLPAAKQLLSLYTPQHADTSGPLTATPTAVAYAAILTDFVFTCPSTMNARALAARGVDVRKYVFAQSPSCMYVPQPVLGLLGAAHSFELPFVFGVTKLQPLKGHVKPCSFSDAEKALSLRMSKAWRQVVHGEAMPNWSPYTRGAYLSKVFAADGDDQVVNYRADRCQAIARALGQN